MRARMHRIRLLSAVFAIGFAASLFATFNTFAAANLFKIQNAELVELSATAEGNITTSNESNITSNVTFHQLGDSAKFKITLKNDSDNDCTIEEITDDNNNAYIIYSYDPHNNFTVNSGSIFDFVVTATYENPVLDINERVQTSNVKFSIKYEGIEEPDDINILPPNTNSDPVPAAPNTGASTKQSSAITSNIAFLITFAAGLIVCLVIIVKRNKKLAKIVVAFIAAILTTTAAMTAKAATIEINNFNFNNSTYNLLDKLVVTYHDVDNNPEQRIINYNETITLDDVEKPNYDFIGWKLSDGTPFDLSADITSDVSIYPAFIPHAYTISYTGLTAEEKAALNNPTSYTIESQTFNLNNPTNRRDSDGDETEHFVGWRDTSVLPTITLPNQDSLSNKSFEAVWAATAPVEYEISYNYDGGTAENPTNFTKFTDTFTLNEPEKPGYTFIGWTGTDLGDTPTRPVQVEQGTRKDLSFTAHYHQDTTIVFDKNNDDATGTMSDFTFKFNETKNLPANGFTRVGYNFNGWNTKADGTGTDYADTATINSSIAGDDTAMVLYAKWDPIHCTIIFDKNSADATGTMQNIDTTYGETVNLTTAAFEREHYLFYGWNTAADGTGTHYDDGASLTITEPVTSLTLYVEWVERASILNIGSTVGPILKSINADVTAFRKYNGTPDFDAINGERIISLPTEKIPVYAWNDNGTIYWWSEAENVYLNPDSSYLFSDLNNIESIELNSFDTSKATTFKAMFHENYKLTDIATSGIDTSNVTSLAATFIRCLALNNLTITDFDTSNVTDFSNTFKETAFTSLDLSSFDTSKGTTYKGIIAGMPNLVSVDFTGFDFSRWDMNLNMIDAEKGLSTNVHTLPETIILDNATLPKTLNNAFSSETNNRVKTISLKNAKTIPGTSMEEMFKGCSKLENIDFTGIDTSNVTNMASMFESAKSLQSLDLRPLDVSKVTTMKGMFMEDEKLETVNIDGWNTESLEITSSMFTRAKKLKNIDLSNLNVDKVTNMELMFRQTESFGAIDLSTWNMDENTSMKQMFLYTRVNTIYVNKDFNTNKVEDFDSSFYGVSGLVGGAGTTFGTDPHTINGYIRIDDPDNGNPGYLSLKDARYVRFNANGGEGTMASRYFSTVTPENIPANEFTNGAYVFAGWNTAADGTGTAYAAEAPLTNITMSKTPLTLYAQW